MNLTLIQSKLDNLGLITRGAFLVQPTDDVPVLANGAAAVCIVIVGNAGRSMWHSFIHSAEYKQSLMDGDSDLEYRNPLDHWTERMMRPLAKQLDAEVLFPFDGPPYLPFQRWAARAECLETTPMGLLIHPEFGLWHALRGALLFPHALDDMPLDALPTSACRETLCSNCATQPCLTVCPVNAYSKEGFKVSNCIDFLQSKEVCWQGGCQARNACAYGASYKYSQDELVFHTQAFYDNHS